MLLTAKAISGSTCLSNTLKHRLIHTSSSSLVSASPESPCHGLLFQTFSRPQSSDECSNSGFQTQTLKLEKHRRRKSVQHDENGLNDRLKSAEDLHLEAVRELYLSCEDAHIDALANDSKQSTYLTSKHRTGRQGKTLDRSGGGEYAQPEAIPANRNASSCSLRQTEPQDNAIGMAEDEVKKQFRDLNQEHTIMLELNKAVALANRNLRLCQVRVAEARKKGMLFPSFESLLVEKKWLSVLQGEFQKPYMETLRQFVSQEAGGRIPIYPPPAKLFNAFNLCPFDQVKVVIIGQDPYHAPGQAMGLCFSVENGIRIPSSLLNIFKEIQNDLGCSIPIHGNLEKWAYQGVLLLNTVLTVREHLPNSHAKKGWELFTDAAIKAISQQKSGVVFLLWGKSAQEKIRSFFVWKHFGLLSVWL